MGATTWCDSLILACRLNHGITGGSITESSFACSSSIQMDGVPEERFGKR